MIQEVIKSPFCNCYDILRIEQTTLKLGDEGIDKGLMEKTGC